MKGTTTPDIGFGMGGNPASTNLSAIDSPIAPLTRLPQGWSLHSGFTKPGIKAGVPRRERRWLTSLRKQDLHHSDISAARINAIAETLDDDRAIDDIMSMLDVSIASEPQASYLLEPKTV